MNMQLTSHSAATLHPPVLAAVLPAADHGLAPAAAGASLRVLVLEDDPVFAGALARAVRALGEGWEVLGYHCVADALQALADAPPGLQLALIDLSLPDGSGLEVIRALRAQRPDVPCLVISSVTSERSLFDAIAEGARGYLHKSEPLPALTASIAQVLQGHYPVSPSLARYLFQRLRPPPVDEADRSTDGGTRLTPKETQTLRCIAQGMTYAEAAADMGVSLSTVQSHIRSLYRKLEVRSQVQAVSRAREKGIL